MSKIKNIPNIEENKLFNNLDFKKLKFSPSPKDFITYKEGSVIYKTGEETDYIYLLAQGSVKIKINVPGETAKIVKIESNDFFGEKELIDNTKRMSSAVANSDSIIVSIKKSDISTFLDRQADFKKNLYQHTYEEAKPNSNSAQAILKKELEPIQSPFPIDFNEIDNKENSEPVVNIDELRLDDLLNDTENKFINVDNLDDETTFRVFNDAIADASELEPEKKEEKEKNPYTFPFNTLNVTDEEQLIDEEIPVDYSTDSDSDLYENDDTDFNVEATIIEDKQTEDNNTYNILPYSTDSKENEEVNEFSFLNDNIDDEIELEKEENEDISEVPNSLNEGIDSNFLEDYHEGDDVLDYSADFLFENDEKKPPLSFDLNDLDDNDEFSFLKNKDLDTFSFQDSDIDDPELYKNETDLEISSLDDFKFTAEEKEEKPVEDLFEDFSFNTNSSERSFLINDEEINNNTEEEPLNISEDFNDLSDSVKFPKDTASEIKIDLEFDNIDDSNSWKLSPEQEEALITAPLFKPEEDNDIKLDDFQLDDILDDDIKFSPFESSSINETLTNDSDKKSEEKEIEPPLFEDFFVDGLKINDDEVGSIPSMNSNDKEEFKVTFYDNDNSENSWNNFDFNLQDEQPEFSLPTDLNSIPLSESLLNSNNSKNQNNDEDISKKLQAFANILLEDLKSPLKVIKTSTDILSQKETNEQLKQVLEIINTQADSVFNNLQNYLDFNNGDVVLSTSTYDFNDVIDEVIVKLAQYTSSANKNVFKKLSSVKFNVNVDKEKIYLVFYQIIKYFILVEPAITNYYILAIKRGNQAIIEFRVKEGKFGNKDLSELFNTNNIKNLAEKGNIGLALALNIIKKHNGSFETEALSSGASIKIILNI